MATNATTGALPAVVTIADLPAGTTLTGAELLEAVQTVGGIANSIQVTVSQILTSTLGGLPSGGGTGQLLTKASATSFATQWSSVSSLVTASTGIAVAGSTTVQVSLATIAGLSLLGVAGTATIAPAAITANASSQVLQSNPGGTGLVWASVGTNLLPGPFQTSSLTAFGSVYGNGASPLGATAAGTTAWPLVGNGTSAAPGFAVLTVPGGGHGTATLTANGIVFGNGTSTVGITAAGTTAWPLVGNGTSVAPGFAVLTVPGGGHGTATLTANGVIFGNGTSTVGITAAGTAFWPLLANGTLSAPTFQQVNLTASVTGVLGIANGGMNATTLATGSVLFFDGTSVAQNNSNFFWGNATTVLAIGTTSPTIGAGEHEFVYGSSAAAHIALRVNNANTSGFSTLWLGAANEGFIRYGSGSGNKLQLVSSSTTVVVSLACNAVDQLIAANTAVLIAPPLGVLVGSAVPAGGIAGLGITISSATNFGVFFGTGVPSLAAGTGSIYLRNDSGATNTSRLYVNVNGSTAWTAFATVA